jgi:hypothetical protein
LVELLSARGNRRSTRKKRMRPSYVTRDAG